MLARDIRPCHVHGDDMCVRELLTPACPQRVRETRREQEAVERDCSGLTAQEQRFRDEISRKQQQVWDCFVLIVDASAILKISTDRRRHGRAAEVQGSGG